METGSRAARGAVFAATAALTLAAVAAYLHAGSGREGAALDLAGLTGAPARLVWVRQVEGDGTDVFAEGAGMRLMGLDTADRRGERAILEAVGSYHKPMITPRGDRVVYTDRVRGTIHAVSWSGASRVDLAEGIAVALWMDPRTGKEWVYALPPKRRPREPGSGPLFRFPLDSPAGRETVWDATRVTFDGLSVAADGRLGGLFPWPRAGIADPSGSSFLELGRGCWTALEPERATTLWIFDGSHRNLIMRSTDGSRRWKVAINGGPGVEGFEVYHPRWSNRSRFIAVTGPYRAGEGENRIRAGGPGVEILVGRLDERLAEVEAWARVTENDQADFFPDLWVAAGGPHAAGEALGTEARAAAAGGSSVVEARLVELTATPTLGSIAPYRNALVVGAWEVTRLVSGPDPGKVVRVAAWGIRDGRTLRGPGPPGTAARLEIEPYEGRADLEGERVVDEISRRAGPLYVEAGGG